MKKIIVLLLFLPVFFLNAEHFLLADLVKNYGINPFPENQMNPMLVGMQPADEEGHMFICTYYSLLEIDENGIMVRQIGEKGQGLDKFEFLMGFDRDPVGNFYLLDYQKKSLLQYDPEGVFTRRIPLPENYIQSFTAINENQLLYPSMTKQQILLYDINTESSTVFSEGGGFISSDNTHIFVYSYIPTTRVQVYSMNRELLDTIDLAEHVMRPASAIFPDYRGGFFITTYDQGILRYDRKGRKLWEESSFGMKSSLVSSVPKVGIDNTGALYVGDMNADVLYKLRMVPELKRYDTAEENLGAFYNSREGERAFHYLFQAYQKDPQNPDILMPMARHFLERNYFSEALLYAARLEKAGHPGGYELKQEAEFLRLVNSAQAHVSKFRTLLEEAGPESAAYEYGKAVTYYEKALKINGDHVETRQGYNTLKSEYLSLTGDSGIPKITIESSRISPVFAAQYKFYEDNPCGEVVFSNSTGKVIDRLYVEMTVKDFMDYPSESRSFRRIEPDAVKSVDLYAVFNNHILDLTEDGSLNGQISIHYTIEGEDYTISRSQAFKVLNRNALTWDNSARLSSFITPRDPAVKIFARSVLNQYRFHNYSFLNSNLLNALKIFDVLGTYGLQYVKDPKTPYTELYNQKNSIDYVQFPREVLRFKTGDCDDLTALYCALLENIGIQTAFVTVPGHIFMAFDSGIPASRSREISHNRDRLILHNDTVWIPVECTMVGESFLSAWEKAASQYSLFASRNSAEFITTGKAWQSYNPVTLKSASWEPVLPGKEYSERNVMQDINSLINEELKPQLDFFDKKLSARPGDARILNKKAVLLARYGKRSEAERILQKLHSEDEKNVSVLINLCNIYILDKKTDRAETLYQKALALEPGNLILLKNMKRFYERTGNTSGFTDISARLAGPGSVESDKGLGERADSAEDDSLWLWHE